MLGVNISLLSTMYSKDECFSEFGWSEYDVRHVGGGGCTLNISNIQRTNRLRRVPAGGYQALEHSPSLAPCLKNNGVASETLARC